MVATFDEAAQFLGTCALFRRDDIAITAAHVVGDLEGGELQVYFPRLRRGASVVEVIRHDTADLALLRILPPADESKRPEDAFWDFVSNLSLGEEFIAYGFPTQGPGMLQAGPGPTARLFRGHYQRYLDFDSGRYQYLAGEMSIPAPIGLSGGPLFRDGAMVMLTGIVTASTDNYSIVDSVEIVDSQGVPTTHENRRIISYGIALMLYPFADWINEVAPRTGS
jgi:hypothetical protein